MIVQLQIIPLGVGTSLSRYIAAVEQVIERSGLPSTVHAMGTNIEGEWEDISALIMACHDKLESMGVPRIATTVHISDRRDKRVTMEQKLDSLKESMAELQREGKDESGQPD